MKYIHVKKGMFYLKKVVLYFDETNKGEILETFEDIQNELIHWAIPFKAVKGKSFFIKTDLITLKITEFVEENIKEFDKAYIPEKFKKKHNKDLKEKNKDLEYFAYPLQIMVDAVLDIKNEFENNHKIEEINKKTEMEELKNDNKQEGNIQESEKVVLQESEKQEIDGLEYKNMSLQILTEEEL